MHFNPRPREEGDQASTKILKRHLISIHALVKRATYADFEQLTGGVISIHALVKRATQRNTPDGTCENDFNPRPREEGDVNGCNVIITADISIHALVKRATLLTACTGFFIAFQSTPS